MSYRVALLGIYHESNTFITEPTTLEDFRNGHWLWHGDIRKEYAEAHHEIGGMLEVMDEESIEVVPIMVAEATPGGCVSAEAFEALLKGMLAGLRETLPVDGCLVVPHGAGVSETERDMDGYWLATIREELGWDIPIIGTLDLHANVSQKMVDHTDALVAYKQNPHLDQRARGREAAILMVKRLRGEIFPRQQFIQLPLVVGIEQQWTDESPSKDIYDYVRQCEAESGILSASVALGFPYADVPEMGTSVIVVYDREIREPTAAERIAAFITNLKPLLVGPKKGINDVIPQLPNLSKPVLLLDMGDNIGGGTSGRGLSLVKGLEADGRFRYFSYQPNPDAVRDAARITIGETFTLWLRGQHGGELDEWKLAVKLLDRVDGKFSEDQPQHGGQTRFDMGETLICETNTGGILMVSSLRIPPFSVNQMKYFNLSPATFDAIIAKGVNAPIAAYARYCQTIIKVDTLGESRADITQLDYTFRRKPLFPFELNDGA